MPRGWVRFVVASWLVGAAVIGLCALLIPLVS